MVKQIEDAQALRRALDEPIYNRIIQQWVGQGRLDYEVYLRTDELLSLQHSRAERANDEELMFQVVHQSQELWMKLLCEEGVLLVEEMDAGDAPRIRARLDRMIRIQRCLVGEIDVLCTLGPREFLTIRRSLGKGSGQESPGYNRFTHIVATGISNALERLLHRRELSLETVYAELSGAPDVRDICEMLLDLDQAFQEWLVRHVMLVRRTIGVDRKVEALDGFPTNALVARMLKPLFPSLWQIRVEITQRWDPSGGFAVGKPRWNPASLGDSE